MKNSIMVIIKIFLVCCIALGAYEIGTPNYKSKIWLDLQSPDGNYAIYVYLVDEPFLFGPQNIKVYCEDKEREGMRVNDYLHTSIGNDGKSLTKENYEFEWIEGGALITFKGEEQIPVSYLIKWENVFQEDR